jgi:hypothetical protein
MPRWDALDKELPPPQYLVARLSAEEQAEYKEMRALLTKWRDNARHAATAGKRQIYLDRSKDQVALMWEMVQPQWVETELRNPRKRYKVSPLLPEPPAEAPVKKIHFVWIQSHTWTWRDSQVFGWCEREWRALHGGWTVEVHDGPSIEAMLGTFYPEILETYVDDTTVLGQKVDLAKYALLDHYGGAIVDFDLLPFVSMDLWLPAKPLVLVNNQAEGRSTNNDFMYATCKSLCSDLLRMACDKIKHAKSKSLYTNKPARLVINTTGPATLTAWAQGKGITPECVVDRWYANERGRSTFPCVAASELKMLALHSLSWRNERPAPMFNHFSRARSMAEQAGLLNPAVRRLPQMAINFFNDMESESEAE